MKRIIRISSLACISLILIGSCRNDANEHTGSPLDQLEAAINKDPSAENIKNYIAEAKKFISSNKEDKLLIKPVFDKASSISIAHNQPFSAISFLMPLVKDYYGDDNTKDNVLNLAKLMAEVKKEHVAFTLYKSYKNNFSGASTDPALEKIGTAINQQLEPYVDTIMTNIFTDPDEFGVNKQNALKFVDVAEAFALANPNSEKSAPYLYKAAEVARSIRTFPKALTIYDWLIEKYPNYEKTPTSLFLKGFLLDNEVKNLELAKETYELFIQKYPEHEMASHVKFLVENLGKSDEEILEIITQKNNQNG